MEGKVNSKKGKMDLRILRPLSGLDFQTVADKAGLSYSRFVSTRMYTYPALDCVGPLTFIVVANMHRRILNTNRARTLAINLQSPLSFNYLIIEKGEEKL